MGKMKPIAIALIAVIVVAAAGAWIYINVIKDDAPKALSVDDAGSKSPTTTGSTGSSGSPASSATIDGTWKIAADSSTVGYRVNEVLMGQKTVAVGRTKTVTGSIEIEGTKVTSGSFEADIASMKSDESRRDGQFSGRIMDAANFPTATFTFTSPVDLGSIPSDGDEISTDVPGTLTLKGVNKDVTVKVTAKRSGDTIKVSGSQDVLFADYKIDNPSFGPVETEDHGVIEFALAFSR